MPKVTRYYAAEHNEGKYEGEHVVHIEGVGLIGSDTLCGHTDRTDIR